MATILIVDDDSDLAGSMADVLRDDGHSVRVASNGEEGLVQLAAELPEVVLLDVEMPVLDGPGMAWRMFVEDAGKERIPIVLLSGIADLHRIARRVGTEYFTAKPFAPAALRVLLARALVERHPAVPRPRGGQPGTPGSQS